MQICFDVHWETERRKSSCSYGSVALLQLRILLQREIRFGVYFKSTPKERNKVARTIKLNFPLFVFAFVSFFKPFCTFGKNTVAPVIAKPETYRSDDTIEKEYEWAYSWAPWKNRLEQAHFISLLKVVSATSHLALIVAELEEETRALRRKESKEQEKNREIEVRRI